VVSDGGGQPSDASDDGGGFPWTWVILLAAAIAFAAGDLLVGPALILRFFRALLDLWRRIRGNDSGAPATPPPENNDFGARATSGRDFWATPLPGLNETSTGEVELSGEATAIANATADGSGEAYAGADPDYPLASTPQPADTSESHGPRPAGPDSSLAWCDEHNCATQECWELHAPYVPGTSAPPTPPPLNNDFELPPDGEGSAPREPPK
jgi:hypothetical protein